MFSSHRLEDFGLKLNPCFIFSAAVIGLPLHFDEHVENKTLDHEYKFFSIVHKKTRKACISRAVRRVIYKLFSCSPNIPRGFIAPVNP